MSGPRRRRATPVRVISAAMLLSALAGCGGASDPDPEATPSSARTAFRDDAATRAGACHILVGPDGAVSQALALVKPDNGSSAERDERAKVQDRLFAIVAARNAKLGDAAGQLVDVLDAPSYFVKNGRPDATVRRTVATINKLCNSG